MATPSIPTWNPCLWLFWRNDPSSPNAICGWTSHYVIFSNTKVIFIILVWCIHISNVQLTTIWRSAWQPLFMKMPNLDALSHHFCSLFLFFFAALMISSSVCRHLLSSCSGLWVQMDGLKSGCKWQNWLSWSQTGVFDSPAQVLHVDTAPISLHVATELRRKSNHALPSPISESLWVSRLSQWLVWCWMEWQTLMMKLDKKKDTRSVKGMLQSRHG